MKYKVKELWRLMLLLTVGAVIFFFWQVYSHSINSPTEPSSTNSSTEQPTSAIVQEIEIKGIKIGMTQEEVEAKTGKLQFVRTSNFGDWNIAVDARFTLPEDFTIAGVAGVRGHPPSLEFHEGKLDKFSFGFNRSSFSHALEALQGKYPSIQCDLVTSRGTICSIDDTNSRLIIGEYVGVSNSVIILSSQRSMDESTKRSEESKKDL